MRTLSITAFASFLILWGVYSYMKDKASTKNYEQKNTMTVNKSPRAPSEDQTLLTTNKRRDLDKIGSVINEENVDIDSDTKDQIRIAKKVYDEKQMLLEKQVLLEQSFMDHNSSIKDIRKLQGNIIELKNKMKQEMTNTEKWDPNFLYYLMIQENYTYGEINMIKSLSENGLSSEEINYITELVKENEFKERISSFKNQGVTGRAIASLKKKVKEKDDFIEDPAEDGASIESKLIEMNYNQEEKEEMVYGSNQ